MVTRVVITGLGLCSALGNLPQTWQGILAQQSGLRLSQPFPELPPRPMGLLGLAPQPTLTPLLQAVVSDALADAQLHPPLANCGVVFGSSRHHQGLWESRMRSAHGNQAMPSISPHIDSIRMWMQLWPGTSAVDLVRWLQIDGPVLSPMAACATGLWAIAQGYELLQMGLCQRVVVATVEVPITPLALAGFEQAGILARTGVYPFDTKREGLAIAEGGAAFVLETAVAAEQRQVVAYGEILGLGLAADAFHMSTPHPEGRGARIALRSCLERSHLHPQDIDYIHTHGTGTPWNDQTEARLIQEEFATPPPSSSTKGATGHTLGASGGLAVALTLMAFKHQVLPPNVGLQSPDFLLPFITTPTPSLLNTALCFSFGFGGQSAVIALGVV